MHNLRMISWYCNAKKTAEDVTRVTVALSYSKHVSSLKKSFTIWTTAIGSAYVDMATPPKDEHQDQEIEE
jgi:hypothetical protein